MSLVVLAKKYGGSVLIDMSGRPLSVVEIMVMAVHTAQDVELYNRSASATVMIQ